MHTYRGVILDENGYIVFYYITPFVGGLTAAESFSADLLDAWTRTHEGKFYYSLETGS